MPYTYPSNIPSYVSNQSKTFQKEFIERFNDCYAKLKKSGLAGDDLDNQARICAWSRMKAAGWEKNSKTGKWEKKTKGVSDNLFLTLKIYNIDEDKRRVFGYATTPALDYEHEVVERDAINEAIKDFAKRSTLREMHVPWAVGNIQVLEMDEKGLWIEAEVVDDSAWKKVMKGVYSMFSIGFKKVNRVVQEGITYIKKLLMFEVSLVDVGCNPESFMGFSTKEFDKIKDMDFLWCDTREDSMDTKLWLLTDERLSALPDSSFVLIKDNKRLLPHEDEEGNPVIEACINCIDVLNGAKIKVGGPNIMNEITPEEREDAYKHLADHLKELDEKDVTPLSTLSDAFPESDKNDEALKSIGAKAVDFLKSIFGDGKAYFPSEVSETAKEPDKRRWDFDELADARSLGDLPRVLDEFLMHVLFAEIPSKEKITHAKRACEAFKKKWVELFESVADKVLGFKRTPSHTKSVPKMSGAWDKVKAVNRLRKWASSDGSGEKEKVTWKKYALGFAWYDPDNADNFEGYKLPHHDIDNGTFKVHEGGTEAAVGAVQGARGGVKIPEGDFVAVKAHLKKHYKQFDREVPWEKEKVLGFKIGAKISKARLTKIKEAVSVLSELISEVEKNQQEVKMVWKDKERLEVKKGDEALTLEFSKEENVFKIINTSEENTKKEKDEKKKTEMTPEDDKIKETKGLISDLDTKVKDIAKKAEGITELTDSLKAVETSVKSLGERIEVIEKKTVPSKQAEDEKAKTEEPGSDKFWDAGKKD